MSRRTERHRLLDLKTIIARAVPCETLAGGRHYGGSLYRLAVSFPLDLETFVEQTREVEKIVGERCHHSGAGFGMRDVEFDFETREKCAAAAERVRSVNPDYETRVSYLGEDA